MGSETSSGFSRQSHLFGSSLEHNYSLGVPSGNDDNPVHQHSAASSGSALWAFQESLISPKSKRQKIIINGSASTSEPLKMSHITVERTRRKVMNERLSVLRSLMPRFYINKSDKASIIGGVVNYIHELQQILRSLECKKKSNKASSPKLPPPSGLPLSPSTSRLSAQPAFRSPMELFPASDVSSTCSTCNDSIVKATSRSGAAEVEVRFSGPNLLLKTSSRRVPGQAMRIISALEQLELEILDATITTLDNKTIIYSFTIKIGIECQLSAEELAQQIRRTFC